MKKIIGLILGSFAMAFSTKAASVDWQMTNCSSAEIGSTVYLVSALDQWASQDELKVAAEKLGSGTSGVVIKDGRFIGTGTIYAEGSGVTADSMKSAYVVLVKDSSATEYKYIQVDYSANVYNDPTEAKEGATTDMQQLISEGTQGTFGGGPGPEPVPEPTSAMLLMLGVAGLALRRRTK